MAEFQPLVAGLPKLPGFGMQGFNGGMNDMVMQLLENMKAPGAARTTGGAGKSMSAPAPGGGGAPGTTAPAPVAAPRRGAGPRTAAEAPITPYSDIGEDETGPGEDPYSISSDADMFAQMVYDILMGGAGKADYTEAFNPVRTQMERQIKRTQADTLEQFGNMNAQYGSGAVRGLADIGIEGAEGINSILGQLEFGADEANRQRMIQGAMQLGNQLYGSQEGAANREMQLLQMLLASSGQATGQAGGVGMFMQGVDQGALDAAYKEWLRTEQGWTDEMLAFLGTPAPTSGAYYESNWFDQFMPMFTAMLTSGNIDWSTIFGSGGTGTGSFISGGSSGSYENITGSGGD
jgi:hypothetical protein